MPYIITTRRDQLASTLEGGVVSTPVIQSRRAVATLDEARESAWSAAGWALDAPDVPGGIHDVRRGHDGFNVHSGGTIGPLPDGTTITVERVEWRDLASTAGITNVPERGNVLAVLKAHRIIDAYNAAQEQR